MPIGTIKIVTEEYIAMVRMADIIILKTETAAFILKIN